MPPWRFMPGLVCLCSIVTRWSLTHCCISMFDLCMMLTPPFNTNLVTFVSSVDCCWGADYRKIHFLNTSLRILRRISILDLNILSPFLPSKLNFDQSLCFLWRSKRDFFFTIKQIISWFARICIKIYFIPYFLFFCTLGSTASVQEKDIQSQNWYLDSAPCPCAQISILFVWSRDIQRYQHSRDYMADTLLAISASPAFTCKPASFSG